MQVTALDNSNAEDSNGSDYCIDVENLKKYYGEKSIAVDGISFQVKYGEVFGFIGPNGAGKTTTINILTTVIPPSSGNASVFGYNIKKNQLLIRKRIGVILQEPSFETNLSVERSLNLYGLLCGLSTEKRKLKVNETLEQFDLTKIRERKSEELSIGQRRRVQVAREFMHNMDLLFLDEPTVGLDTASKRKILYFIKEKVKDGLTVFFTTHNMEEAEFLCDKIAVIKQGKIVANDTPKGLRERSAKIRIIQINFKNPINSLIVEDIKLCSNNSYIQLSGDDDIRIHSKEPQELMIELLKLFKEKNIEIRNISIDSPTLEDTFLDLVSADTETTNAKMQSDR